MSAAEAVQTALASGLRADPALAELTAVFDAPPLRAALPWALVEDPVLGDAGTKTGAGRAGRLAVLIHDGGERPVRLRRLAAAAEARVAASTSEIGDGWRLVVAAPVRSRVAKRGDGWVAALEFQVRLHRSL